MKFSISVKELSINLDSDGPVDLSTVPLVGPFLQSQLANPPIANPAPAPLPSSGSRPSTAPSLPGGADMTPPAEGSWGNSSQKAVGSRQEVKSKPSPRTRGEGRVRGEKAPKPEGAAIRKNTRLYQCHDFPGEVFTAKNIAAKFGVKEPAAFWRLANNKTFDGHLFTRVRKSQLANQELANSPRSNGTVLHYPSQAGKRLGELGEEGGPAPVNPQQLVHYEAPTPDNVRADPLSPRPPREGRAEASAEE